MSEKLRLQEPIRSPLETPRLITPLPYRSGTSFLAWAIVNNNQPVPDVFSKMTKIAASGRLGLYGCTAKWDAKTQTCKGNRKSGVEGKGVKVRAESGGLRNIKKKKITKQ